MKIPLLFALVGTLCCGSVSWAQTAPNLPLKPAPEAGERTFQIPIKNVKASLMAWWLDPTERPLPSSSGVPPRPFFNPTRDKLGLPLGVSRIIAVDPQNSLLVLATPEGVAKLGETIRFLDRPLRQVEVEGRFFQVASEEVDKLGLTLSSTWSRTPFSRIKGNVEQMLDSAVKRKKAILLTAPRVVAFNNATAELIQQTGRPAKLGVAPPQGSAKFFANQEGFEKLAQNAALQVVTNRSWKLTPTLNNDDTITLVTQVEQNLELQGQQKADGALVLERQAPPQIIVNVRDGETIAFEEQTLPSSATSKVRTIVLLTTRIIRRTGDDNGTGKTDIPGRAGN